MAAALSSGNSGFGFQIAMGPNHLVDYSNYRYVLFFYAGETGENMQLCGARIMYTPPSIFGVALPTILENNP